MFCKLCDWLALIFYMKRERDLGNMSLNEQWERGKEGLTASIESVKEMLSNKFKGYNLNFSELNNLITNIYG